MPRFWRADPAGWVWCVANSGGNHATCDSALDTAAALALLAADRRGGASAAKPTATTDDHTRLGLRTRAPPMIIDADSHLYETRDLWRSRVAAADRDLALHIADDALGYSTLRIGDRIIETLGVHDPGDNSQSGAFRTRLEAGLGPERPYDSMPADYSDVGARVARLDADGIDAAIVFGNCAIMWEQALWDDVRATQVNMAAWNRRCGEIVVEGAGRLHPVAQVSLRDPAWAEAEVVRLAAAGVRTVLLAPAPVAGRRLSHPDHDRFWSACAHHGVAVVFHIAQYPLPFDAAWTVDDPDWSNPLLGSVFMWTGPALALADLATRGVLARNPALRIGVVELLAAWFPLFLLQVDGAFRFHADFNGAPLAELTDAPSSYLKRQVRLAAFPFERPTLLAAQSADVYMFGSDYPHPEGLREPVGDYERIAGTTAADAPSLWSENAAWLLGT